MTKTKSEKSKSLRKLLSIGLAVMLMCGLFSGCTNETPLSETSLPAAEQMEHNGFKVGLVSEQWMLVSETGEEGLYSATYVSLDTKTSLSLYHIEEALVAADELHTQAGVDAFLGSYKNNFTDVENEEIIPLTEEIGGIVMFEYTNTTSGDKEMFRTLVSYDETLEAVKIIMLKYPLGDGVEEVLLADAIRVFDTMTLTEIEIGEEVIEDITLAVEEDTNEDDISESETSSAEEQ